MRPLPAAALEHGGPELLIGPSAGPRPMAEVLPDAFGPDDLAVARPATERTASP